MGSPKKKNDKWQSGASDHTATKTALETSPNANLQELLDEANKRHPALIIMQGDKMGEVIALAPGAYTIGRHPDCDIVIAQRAVSGFHALLRVTEGSVILEDSKSTNGTFLNKEQLSRPAVLQAQDLLKIGATVLRYVDSKLDASFTKNLHTQSTEDPLTGVFNKGHILKTLKSSIEIARSGYPLCLIMLDLDHFKSVNDTYGHMAGDYVLKKLCQLLSELVRGEDAIGRFGGEEFVLVLPDSPLHIAAGISERIRKTIEDYNFEYQGKKIPVTASLGVASWEPKFQTAEDFLDFTDKLLYHSKQNGRNQVSGVKEFEK